MKVSKKVYTYSNNCFQVKYKFYFQIIETKVEVNYLKRVLSVLD